MKHLKSMPCPQWAEKIAARHPYDLSPADHMALREHMLSCPACTSTYAAYAVMEVGIRHLPQVEPKRPLSPELLYQQQGKKQGHIFPLVVVGFRQTTSQLLSYSRELQQSLPRTVRIANALGALLVVGLMVSGFIWLLAGPHFTVGGSTTGSHSRSQLKSYAISPTSKSSPIPVPSSPTLAVSSSNLSPNNCTSRVNSWTCTVTLSLASSSQGDLNWSASSDLSGVTFTPSSGTLAPGQTVQVSISISDVTCPTTTTFRFAGPSNTIHVPWSCSPLPTPTPSDE